MRLSPYLVIAIALAVVSVGTVLFSSGVTSNVSAESTTLIDVNTIHSGTNIHALPEAPTYSMF